MARVGCGNCFLGWFALAGVCASGQALNDSPTIPDGDNWFDHPDILCTALQTLGYHARSWGQIGGSPVYNCMYPPVVRPADTPAAIDAMLATAQPPAPLTLGFEVSGLNPRQADSVRIAVTVPAREATAKAKDQMLKCIDSLYSVIGQRVPSALTAYVQREQRYLSHQRYGTVFFVVTSDHDARVFWFYLRKSP